MIDKFCKMFKKIELSNEEKWLLGSAKSFNAKLDRDAKALLIEMEFSERADCESVFSIEDKLKAAYLFDKVRLITRYPSEMFGDKQINNDLIKSMKRFYCMGNGFFENSVFAYDIGSSKLGIDLRDGISAELLKKNGAEVFLKDLIKKQFDLDITVELAGELSPEYIASYTSDVPLPEPPPAPSYPNASFAESDYTSGSRRRKESQKAAQAGGEKQETIMDKACSFDPLDGGDEIFEDETGNIRVGRMCFDISSEKPIYGKSKNGELTAIRRITDSSFVRFLCEVVDVDSRDNYDTGKVTYRFTFTDNDSSIMSRVVLLSDEVIKLPKIGDAVIAEGKAQYSKYDTEIVVALTYMAEVKRVRRKDMSKEKRVELHLHTNMSALDALTTPEQVMRTASEWGMKAVAITDHGNVQAFPEIMKLRKKYPDVKPLYGIEGYLVDDTARALYTHKGADDITFKDGTFTIFDIETTGLSAATCGITQIAAVKYRGGETGELFETYVNPEMPIPENITELTGITDEMVANAPSQEKAVRDFLRFAEGTVLVAHNAAFDTGFIKKVCYDYGMPFDFTFIDTVMMSRYINSELKNHKLNTLAEYFELGDFDHHRAMDDTVVLAKIFECMVRKFMAIGVSSLEEMREEMANGSDPRKLKYHHIIIFAANLTGLKNLYRLISSSYIDYYYRYPRIPKTVLNEHREGLILGSACCEGELYQALIDGKRDKELEDIASFCDYLEIQPHSNNQFLVDENRLATDTERAYRILDENVKKIIALGKKLDKPVCATGDVHFLDPEDEIYRKILQTGMKFQNPDRDIKLYFRTTEEMLEAFSFLDEATAREVVIKNPNLIADMIEDIKPIPDGTYTPGIEGAEEQLETICYQTAKDWYGDPLPTIVAERIEKELSSIIKNGFAVLYIIARDLVKNSEEKGYLVGSRGSVGSSFIATISGVSEVNPLPPHYRCPSCKNTEFIEKGVVGSGYDLEDKSCELCGAKMIGDGQDIPFETFLGFHGEKAPDIDLNFSGDVQSEAHKRTEELFGSENIFRAGTIGTLQSKTCFAFVKDYLLQKNKDLTKAEMNRLIAGFTGVKRTTGQHPGGIIVIPKDCEIYDFTPIQHPADKASSNVITTHFAFEYLHDTLLKLDILGHDVPTIYKLLKDYTGIDVRDVPLNDKEVYSLFSSTRALGVSPEEIDSPTGTFGLPELGTNYVRQMIIAAKPKTFADLVQISGLSHGTGIWLGNGEELIKNGICTIEEIIGTRDSIMVYLMQRGMKSSSAFEIMERVRKGKGLTREQEEEMRAANIEEWYISSCKKIKYMFPKAHAVAYIMSAIRIAWYKVHEPLAFYASFFTVKADSFDAEMALSGRRRMKSRIKELEDLGKQMVAKDKDEVAMLQVIIEMLARGLQFLPVDVYKSTAQTFVPEDGRIRLPLIALKGLGEKAADSIYHTIQSGMATTLDDLKIKASLNKNNIDVLVRNNCLGDMPLSDQISMF